MVVRRSISILCCIGKVSATVYAPSYAIKIPKTVVVSYLSPSNISGKFLFKSCMDECANLIHKRHIQIIQCGLKDDL